MILGFEYFHPLNGEYPNTFPSYGKDIVHRARSILQNRTITDIKIIAEAINWISDHKSIKDKLSTDLDTYIDLVENGKEPKYLGNTFTSIYGINFYKQNYAPPDTGIENLQWFEVYATLALTLIDQAINDEQFYASWAISNEWLHEWRIVTHSATWLIEAMEAIALAEGLQSIEVIGDLTKNKLRERNTQAAIQRHAATNNAIVALYEMFNQGTYKSMSNAAQIFSEKFPEKVAHLAPYNRVRTLSNGLSNFIKGQRRSLQ